jgi:hypothetical protein
MRSVRLGRTFDAVFVHDAVCYLTTEADLRAAMETVFTHLRPGGAAIFVPDCTRESFEATTDHGGHDGDGRSLRYLEWTHDPDPSDTTYDVDYAYILREDGQPTRCEYDRHINGMFAQDDWLRWLAEAGFAARAHRADVPDAPPGYTMFVAVRP